MKCPRCGGKNIAEMLYGLPSYDEKTQSEIKAGKLRLGGCCASELDPKYYCNDCKKGFATPPLIKSKDGFEDLREVVTCIRFSIGGFFGGCQSITFEKKKYAILLSVTTKDLEPQTPDGILSGILGRAMTEKEWEKLLNNLFCKLCVHEWKKRYENPGVLDGEGWSLEFKLTGGRQRNYYGSNAYPPLWKELKNVLRPFFKEFGIVLGSNI